MEEVLKLDFRNMYVVNHVLVETCKKMAKLFRKNNYFCQCMS